MNQSLIRLYHRMPPRRTLARRYCARTRSYSQGPPMNESLIRLDHRTPPAVRPLTTSARGPETTAEARS
jgi:hypothetical protein